VSVDRGVMRRAAVRGARPEHEFGIGLRGRPEPEVTERPRPWPCVRVVRHAMTLEEGDTASSVVHSGILDAIVFLDQLGRRQHGIGRSRSLGSVAVSLIQATEIDKMMQEKYGNRIPRRRALNNYRGLADLLQELVRVQAGVHYDSVTDRIAVARHGVSGGAALTAAEQEQLEEYPFGFRVADVKGMQYYGKKRWGFVLPDTQLYHERHELLRHLGREGFDTGQANQGWQPHAVVFELLPHQPDGSVLTYSAAVPDAIALQAPTVSSPK
jgi:hypothetical protein